MLHDSTAKVGQGSIEESDSKEKESCEDQGRDTGKFLGLLSDPLLESMFNFVRFHD